MDERDYAQTIAEIREWLVEINANQRHQTEILTELKATSRNAFDKADKAEDTADQALAMAEEAKADLRSYKDEVKVERRWLAGLFVSMLVALLPIFAKFYL